MQTNTGLRVEEWSVAVGLDVLNFEVCYVLMCAGGESNTNVSL